MINFLNHLIKTYFQFINKYKILFYGISLNVFSSLPNDLKKNPLKTIRPANAVDATTLSGGRLSKKVITNEIIIVREYVSLIPIIRGGKESKT